MIRQLVTGQDSSGNAIFLKDHPITPVEVSMMPGFKTYELWSTSGSRTVPHTGPMPGVPDYFPQGDGTVFRMIEFPPLPADGSSGIHMNESAAAELSRKLPGVLEHLETENPGMHTTDSIDYGIVLKGEICLELDNGQERLLKPGDCVIQNGTRHAWRNRSSEPVLMAFILLGASRNNP